MFALHAAAANTSRVRAPAPVGSACRAEGRRNQSVIDRNLGIIHFPSGAACSPTTSRRARSPHKDLPPPAGRAPSARPDWPSTVQARRWARRQRRQPRAHRQPGRRRPLRQSGRADLVELATACVMKQSLAVGERHDRGVADSIVRLADPRRAKQSCASAHDRWLLDGE
jgi:hypothetical protein